MDSKGESLKKPSHDLLRNPGVKALLNPYFILSNSALYFLRIMRTSTMTVLDPCSMKKVWPCDDIDFILIGLWMLSVIAAAQCE